MKRFITYLYDYEGGAKGKGAGFARVDVRGREVRMEVHVRNAGQFQGKGKLYLITNQDKAVGISAGEVMILNGNGDETFRFSNLNMYGSGMDFTNVIGLAIRCKNGYLASNWQEKDCPELLKGTFEVLSVQKNSSTEEITQAEEIKPKEVKDIIKEESQDNQEVKSSEKQIESQEREEAIYRKIQLAHIRNLPPRNRYLCNNSFVLHGFFNYQYLILKVERIDNEEKLSLGVPGVYETPEKMMAMMFGFSRFEPQDKDVIEPKEGTFGAWFMSLEM